MGRFWKRELAAKTFSLLGIGALLRRLPAWQGLLTLGYHRIGDGRSSLFDAELCEADADTFDAQVRFLKRHTDLVGATDLPRVLKERRGRHALITFDDGYRDNYEIAYPILRRHGAPAIFFITTGFLDAPRPSWWDEIAWMVRCSRRKEIQPGRWLPMPIRFDEPGRDRAIKCLLQVYRMLPGPDTEPYLDFLADETGSGRCPASAATATWMTWDMVREMHAAGMGFGGHTVNHPYLPRVSLKEREAEIAGCARRLSEELGGDMRFFSYPHGGPQSFSPETAACLRRHAVLAAFNYPGGFASCARDWHPYNIPRFAPGREVSMSLFRAVVTLPQVFAGTQQGPTNRFAATRPLLSRVPAPS
jgi:peptidoglycan/xylan/chitin deacetylase (PgdA/CDA1 family)